MSVSPIRVLALSIASSLVACASPHPAPAAPAAHAAPGRVGSHGMVLVGDREHAYLSHIPMFGAPHDVQLVLAGSLRLDVDTASPAGFSDASYTFLPDRMSLDEVRAGTLTELSGQVFVGNFEAGGRPLASRARFTVERVVHDRVLVSAAPPAHDGALTYLLFGSRAHAFAAHRIDAAPSFDEILSVEVAGGPTDEALATGLVVTLASGEEAQPARLGRATGATTARASDATFALTVRRELSCLAGPDFDRPCP